MSKTFEVKIKIDTDDDMAGSYVEHFLHRLIEQSGFTAVEVEVKDVTAFKIEPLALEIAQRFDKGEIDGDEFIAELRRLITDADLASLSDNEKPAHRCTRCDSEVTKRDGYWVGNDNVFWCNTDTGVDNPNHFVQGQD